MLEGSWLRLSLLSCKATLFLKTDAPGLSNRTRGVFGYAAYGKPSLGGRIYLTCRAINIALPSKLPGSASQSKGRSQLE
jgi:hypothetical protein